MFNAIVNLFFPKVCFACHNLLSDNENALCTDCRHDLPVTNFHFNQDNSIAKALYGRVKIECGTALFRFEKRSKVQQLIHNLKYKGYEQIGFVLGNWLGGELKTLETYTSIDFVIPVPLHENKLKKRGYNQVTKFGQQIAVALDACYLEDVLIKITNTSSQITKNRFTRWRNQEALFALKNMETLKHKHILLVDDLITTGATIEACSNVLNEIEGIKLSVATIAIA